VFDTFIADALTLSMFVLVYYSMKLNSILRWWRERC
jgi:hypothetical protein